MMRRRKTGGSATVEFVLCGIPLLFAWISTVEMALGMWHYHTLQYATKAAGAFVATRGASYVAQGGTAPKIKDIASVLANNAIGIPASSIQVTFMSFQGGSTTPTSYGPYALDHCETDTTTWPPANSNSVGNNFEIKTTYQWKNAIAMVAPGVGGLNFGAFNLPGFTHQFILF